MNSHKSFEAISKKFFEMASCKKIRRSLTTNATIEAPLCFYLFPPGAENSKSSLTTRRMVADSTGREQKSVRQIKPI